MPSAISQLRKERGMIASRIETPREFFDHVVEVDVSEFLTNPLDLRAAYHACNSLLNLRDWVLTMHKTRPWSSGGAAKQPFAGTGQLQQALEALDQRFAIVTDIANASKHMVLDPARSRTKLGGNANTEVQQVHGGALGSGPIGAAPIGGTSSRIVVKIDDQFHDVRDCVTAVHAIWCNLLTENSW
jgi:hypothetical protein